MYESPPGIAQSRSGHRVSAIYVVGDDVLLRELVRTVLERAADGAPVSRESPRHPALQAPAGRLRREALESETAEALFERFANHVLLARVRALADVS